MQGSRTDPTLGYDSTIWHVLRALSGQHFLGRMRNRLQAAITCAPPSMTTQACQRNQAQRTTAVVVLEILEEVNNRFTNTRFREP